MNHGDLFSGQEAERMRELERELNRPSPLYLKTIGEVASKLGVDVEPLLASEGIQVKELIFHTMHFGAADPEGMTLLIEIGKVPAEDTASHLRQLLEFNMSHQAVVCGFYGVMPGSDAVVMRKRFDLAKSADPATEVVRYVDSFATQMAAMRSMFAATLQMAKTLADAAPADQSPAD